jgi:hypothetical protein
METILRRAYDSLRRFPQLLIFPLVCWLTEPLVRRLLTGLIQADFIYQPLNLPVPPTVTFRSIVSLTMSLLAAYFSAGQVQGFLLAGDGLPLTRRRFGSACSRFGGRILAARLLRVCGFAAIVIIGAVLAIVLKGLAVLMILVALAGLALITLFWELSVIRDGRSVLPALARSSKLVTANAIDVAGMMIIIWVLGALGRSLLGLLPWLGSPLASLFQAVYSAFTGLAIANLFHQVEPQHSVLLTQSRIPVER